VNARPAWSAQNSYPNSDSATRTTVAPTASRAALDTTAVYRTALVIGRASPAEVRRRILESSVGQRRRGRAITQLARFVAKRPRGKARAAGACATARSATPARQEPAQPPARRRPRGRSLRKAPARQRPRGKARRWARSSRARDSPPGHRLTAVRRGCTFEARGSFSWQSCAPAWASLAL